MFKENRLKYEKSPYLLQHQHNPVHWFSWGEEAFQRAQQENKPILLSIGYSTCHWCHVMEKDSFEKEEVAKVLNDHFICIKVDREERPDVDEIYMAAIHAMGQRGGWPLNVFLTPSLKPFYGGTFWWKNQFIALLGKISHLWTSKNSELEQSAEELLSLIKNQKSLPSKQEEILNNHVGQKLIEHSLHTFDEQYGGFGSAPKFPHALQLSALLRLNETLDFFHKSANGPSSRHGGSKKPESAVADEDFLDTVTQKLERAAIYERSLLNDPQISHLVFHTLNQMAKGGIYDHIGGGFSRYSTDEKWLVPHFEKMLYDNALLSYTYLEAYQSTQNEHYAEIAKDILDYVLQKLQHSEGAFYSAEDADSEGEEGKYYTWEFKEMEGLLSSEEFEFMTRVMTVTPEGNFVDPHQPRVGQNVLALKNNYFWEQKQNPLFISAKQKLKTYREKRIPPHLDDKILVSWNGLMLASFAKASKIFQEARYIKALNQGLNFILNQSGLYQGAELKSRYRDGEAKFYANLEDYAFLIHALIEAYSVEFNPEYLNLALKLQEKQDAALWDFTGKAYFASDSRNKELLVRSQDAMDGALPNANAMSAYNLARLFAYNLNLDHIEKAKQILHTFSSLLNRYPQAMNMMWLANHFISQPCTQLVMMNGTDKNKLENILKEIHKTFKPSLTLAAANTEQDFPLILKGKKIQKDKIFYYVCENGNCQMPVEDYLLIRP